MSKQYTAQELAQALREKMKEIVKTKLEALEKAEAKVEEVEMPDDQKVFVTKENKEHFPEATSKEEVAPDVLGQRALKSMDKADPSMKTSAQMAGVKVPGQQKPPAATPKTINNTKATSIQQPKIGAAGSIPKAPAAGAAPKAPMGSMAPKMKLGMGLLKFMEGRSDRLQKSWMSEKGVHHSGATYHSKDDGSSSAGKYARKAGDEKRHPGMRAMDKEVAKQAHKQVLGEIKASPKPNLGKSENKPAPGTVTGKWFDSANRGSGHQPHPGPSKSAGQKAYDAKKQSESEAHLKTPAGEKQRQEGNAKMMADQRIAGAKVADHSPTSGPKKTVKDLVSEKEKMKKSEPCAKGCIQKHEHIGWGKLHGKLEREGYSKESSDKIAGSIKAKVDAGKK